MIGITRRGFLRLAAGTLVLRGALRLSAAEGRRGRLSLSRPQYVRAMGGGRCLVTWITNGGMSRLSIVSAEGRTDWAQTGGRDGDLLHPQGVCVDEEGTAYVCDSRNGRVATFDAQGKAGAPIGRMGFLPGQFHLPQGCDLRGSRLAVADTQNHRVQILDVATGEVERVIGRLGDGEDELRRPSDVAFDGDETLWILDAGHGRAVRFHLEGKRLGQVTAPHGAQGILAARGRLFVSDTRGGRVVSIDPSGSLVSEVPRLAAPRGLCLDEEDLVVCESGADRLSVFALA